MVASPKATAKTPVAAGSSVPAWPAFCAPKAHFTLFTTVVDPTPAGLSTTSQPFTGRPFFPRAMSVLYRGQIGDDADHRPHRKARIVTLQHGRIQPRDGTVKEKRVGRRQHIAEQPGKAVEIDHLI